MGTAVCVAGATKRTFSGLVERRPRRIQFNTMALRTSMGLNEPHDLAHTSHVNKKAFVAERQYENVWVLKKYDKQRSTRPEEVRFVARPHTQQCPLSAHSVPTQCPLSAHTVPTANTWELGRE